MWPDQVSEVIYGWGHRYAVEIGFTIIAFLLVHFIGYPLIVNRHVALSRSNGQQTEPTVTDSRITTGNISTSGPNSGVSIGQPDQATSSKSPADNSALKK